MASINPSQETVTTYGSKSVREVPYSDYVKQQAEKDNQKLQEAVTEQQATRFYGFSEDEWLGFSEFYRIGVRKAAWENTKSPSKAQTQAYTALISSNNTAVYDQMFGDYKYKSFFQNIKDVVNRDNFQAAEGEINAITGARGYIQPGTTTSLPELQGKLRRENNSYSGCDITPSITIGGKTFVIGNLSAISYSVHRDKVPVRTLGRTYPKSYVSGGATIAGTLIFTVFDTHVLDEVRREIVTEVQAAGGQSSPLTQQLPPFDVTIFFQNEYGHSSYMRIYGIEITDESQTHTINDIYTENQMQYVARDIDLMCRVHDEWTPSQLSFDNSTLFSQQRLATPAYRLQHIQVNEGKIGALRIDVARINNELNSILTKLDELGKTTPRTAEIINTETAYNIQWTTLEQQSISKSNEIKRLETENAAQTSNQTQIDDASVNLGSDSSANRDDPYAITRIKSR